MLVNIRPSPPSMADEVGRFVIIRTETESRWASKNGSPYGQHAGSAFAALIQAMHLPSQTPEKENAIATWKPYRVCKTLTDRA